MAKAIQGQPWTNRTSLFQSDADGPPGGSKTTLSPWPTV
jgi:hypothetical protein